MYVITNLKKNKKLKKKKKNNWLGMHVKLCYRLQAHQRCIKIALLKLVSLHTVVFTVHFGIDTATDKVISGCAADLICSLPKASD